jgi:hypothetical protein
MPQPVQDISPSFGRCSRVLDLHYQLRNEHPTTSGQASVTQPMLVPVLMLVLYCVCLGVFPPPGIQITVSFLISIREIRPTVLKYRPYLLYQ